MDAKPIITYHGNLSLFFSLSSFVEVGLPKEICEWKRSYGCGIRCVRLQGCFVPFDADILPEDDMKTLISRPYFHIYWTNCDVNEYKQSVREDISVWCTAMKNKNIIDWMIVVVQDESKARAKLLPYFSVIDKVRNDFCNKQSDRCVLLFEPFKYDSKSIDSCVHFFRNLRLLLIQAYSRHLNKYEEKLQVFRESRGEEGWFFFEYFTMQEELSLMLEMLGLKEDSLQQYDELEAMFCQFVQNHCSGYPACWLPALLHRCSKLPTLSLAKPIDYELRDRVKHLQVSFLEFRTYLFKRQVALLLVMGKYFEIAERTLPFLQTTINEMKSLETDVIEGGLQCWAILIGLEVLSACDICNLVQVDKYYIYKAFILEYICNKLKALGCLCGLMPGMVPSPDQLNRVLDLKSGIVSSQQHEILGRQHPPETLVEALTSCEGFKNRLFEVFELAIATYKQIERFRSVCKLGKELADFYMEAGEAEKAEVLLLEAVKMYQSENWHILHQHSLISLAHCHKMMRKTTRTASYMRSVCQVACSPLLSFSCRLQHFIDLMDGFQEGLESLIDGEGLFMVTNLHLSRQEVTTFDEVVLSVDLISCFPCSLDCDIIQINYLPYSDVSNGSSHHLWSSSHSTQIRATNLYEFVDRCADVVACVGIGCAGLVKQSLRPTTEVYVPDKGTESAADGSQLFAEARAVQLCPGNNQFMLIWKPAVLGSFIPGHLFINVRGLVMRLPLSRQSAVRVSATPMSVSITPRHADGFVIGVEQPAVLSLHAGREPIAGSSAVSFTSTSQVVFSPPRSDNADDRIRLGPVDRHQTVAVDVTVCLPLDNYDPGDNPSVSCSVELNVEGLAERAQCQLVFVTPLSVSCEMYTASCRRFLQVKLVSDAFNTLTVSNVHMSAGELEFSLLNHCIDFIVSKQQPLSLVWEILSECSRGSDEDVLVIFSCKMSHEEDHFRSQQFSQHFRVKPFRTLYILRCSLSESGTDAASVLAGACQVGSTFQDVSRHYQCGIPYLFHWSVAQATSHRIHSCHHRILYSVSFDDSVWSTSCSVEGWLSAADGLFSSSLSVTPVMPGFHRLPFVELFALKQSEIENDTPAAISTFPTVSASGDLVSVSQSSGICDKQCPLYIYNAGVATRVRVVLADGGG